MEGRRVPSNFDLLAMSHILLIEMTLRKEEVKSLAKAVQHWLDFQTLCEPDTPLTKESLGRPIADFLSRRRHIQVQAGWLLPGFGALRVDYVGLRAQRPVLAIGTQWVGEATIDRQHLVDTLLGLHYAKCSGRYFLLAGPRERFGCSQHRLHLKNEAKKLFEPLLPVNSGGPEVLIEDAEEPWRTQFKTFASRYKADLPRSLRLRHLYDGNGDYARVLVWQIRRAR